MLQVRDLTKNYGKLTALDRVSFDIPAGQSVALWGPNGAGKTTVMRCMLGLLRFQGEIQLAGYNVTTEGKKARNHVGFVPQELSFQSEWTVLETIDFFSRLKKARQVDFTSILQQAGLSDHHKANFGELSGGMKQRLALAIALLADPEILMLDEPTSNLDPQGRDGFIRVLNELLLQGKTILFSSHRYEEVAELADRTLVLRQGVLEADCTPGELHKHIGATTQLRIYVDIDQFSQSVEILRDAGLRAFPNGKGVHVEVSPDKKGEPFNVLSNAGIRIFNFDLEQEWKDTNGED